MGEKIKREFKGIWIPKEIWLSDLSLQEKVFLAEIDSLDNGESGCYASNSYFAKFFNISKARCSQVISNLEDKGLLSIELKKEGKQITKRKLKIVTGVVNILNRGSKYSKGGSKFLRSIEQSNNNTREDNSLIVANAPHVATNNKHKKITLSHFDKFISLYPKRKNASKAKALTAWKKLCNKPVKERPKWKTIKKAIKAQKKSDRWKEQPQYIPHPSTWLNQNRWLDEPETLTTINDYSDNSKVTIGAKDPDYKFSKKVTKM